MEAACRFLCYNELPRFILKPRHLCSCACSGCQMCHVDWCAVVSRSQCTLTQNISWYFSVGTFIMSSTSWCASSPWVTTGKSQSNCLLALCSRCFLSEKKAQRRGIRIYFTVTRKFWTIVENYYFTTDFIQLVVVVRHSTWSKFNSQSTTPNLALAK